MFNEHSSEKYHLNGDFRYVSHYQRVLHLTTPAPSSAAGTTGSHKGVENNGASKKTRGDGATKRERWKLWLTLGHWKWSLIVNFPRKICTTCWYSMMLCEIAGIGWWLSYLPLSKNMVVNQLWWCIIPHTLAKIHVAKHQPAENWDSSSDSPSKSSHHFAESFIRYW